MSDITNAYIPPAALTGSMRDFRVPGGADLLGRTEGFFKWQNLRRQTGLWPFSRATEDGPSTVCWAQDDSGNKMRGVNFASQDYLSLSSHSGVKSTAKETIERCGVHSAGSPALVGNTPYSVALERKIADFLKMEEVVLYPTGWAAGFGVIKGLVRSADHVVMDMLSHSCLQEGANAATSNIHLYRHLDNEYCRNILTKIRAKDAENGILVVTEGLFSMDSDTPGSGRTSGALPRVQRDPGCRRRARPGLSRRRRPRAHRHPEHAWQDRYRHGQLLQDLRVKRRLRRLQEPRGEGISALLQRARDLLECAVAGTGGNRSESVRDRRIRSKGARSALR